MVSKCVVLICISLITDNGKQSFMINYVCFLRNAYAFYQIFFLLSCTCFINLDLCSFFKQIFWLDMLQISSTGLKLIFSLAFCYLLVDRSYVDLNANIILITRALNKTWYLSSPDSCLEYFDCSWPFTLL